MAKAGRARSRPQVQGQSPARPQAARLVRTTVAMTHEPTANSQYQIVKRMTNNNRVTNLFAATRPYDSFTSIRTGAGIIRLGDLLMGTEYKGTEQQTNYIFAKKM